MATKIPSLNISLGQKKNVASYTVASFLASGVTASALNYNSYKKGELNKKEAINSALKLSVQGAIATGAAVAAGNYIGDKKYLSVLTALSVGFSGVYAVEKIAERLKTKEDLEEEIESEEE